jgi:penicillin amidase
MRRLQITTSSLLLAAALYAGNWSVGPVPPLGGFLHPRTGVWAVATSAELPREVAAEVAGLESQIRVLYDDRGVPHIFAGSVTDASRALGYVVARDRLFQLELQTRATAGTMSELVGPRALDFDRTQRSYGLAWAAERNFAALDPNSLAAQLLEAYADGVNAWIDGMGPRDLPLEYRLLDARPMRWQPAHTFYLIKRMGFTLSYNASDLRRERIRSIIGVDATGQLFPDHSPIQEPIVPPTAPHVNGGAMEGDSVVAPIPVALRPGGKKREGDEAAGSQPWVEEAGAALGGGGGVEGAHGAGWLGAIADAGPSGDAVGSNNWAVSPARTEAGFALLAGDPHLRLTLPSIWYEVHMVVPGEIDVYGVTIPGVPGVVIGFNRRVAWSFTNTEADVLDFYEEVLDDPDEPTAHAVDGDWRPLTRRIEEFRGPSGRQLATDTLYFTHRGPLLRSEGRARSLRWTVLEESGEIGALAEAATAGSVTDWLGAMERYGAPPQNMLVADWTGSIGIRSTGRFPLRPGDGRGTRIRDGSRSDSDWLGDWPVDRLPQAIDPPQGFLASANQEPLDPSSDSTYLGVNWPGPWRAIRINQLLRADTAVTPEDMQRFQLDPGSARADRFVPAFLQAAERALTRVEGDDELREAAQLLAQWDRRYTRENERAILFELAMDELVNRVWDELMLPAESDSTPPRRISTPGSGVLASLLESPHGTWWDDQRTEETLEDRDAILNASLEAALGRAKAEYGSPEGSGWRWEGIRHANIYHLLGFPSLSALALPIQGGPSTLNPSSGRGIFGASWRMVVELRPNVRAWTIYPGGQSGNPVSPMYRDRIDKWVAGELDPVLFPSQAADFDEDRIAATLILRPRGGER